MTYNNIKLIIMKVLIKIIIYVQHLKDYLLFILLEFLGFLHRFVFVKQLVVVH